jgi:hypothetical protein
VISLLVDQNFNEHIVDGLIRRLATLDVVHVRDIGLATAPDSLILERAAIENRVLLSHDRKTVPPVATGRITAGMRMPGVFLVSGDMPIGQAIDELLIAVCCLSADDCKDIVRYFPL